MSTSIQNNRTSNRRNDPMNHKEDYKVQKERLRELNESASRLIDRIRREDTVGADEVDASFAEVMREVRRDGRSSRPLVRRLWAPLVSVAASVAVLLGGYWWLRHQSAEERGGLQLSLLTQMDAVPSDRIILNIGSQSFALEDDASVSYTQEGIFTANKLRLDGREAEEQEDLNQLSVPYGTHADVILSDGTRIFVNAGSKLIYPREFGDGRREVLLEGEAYLEVAPDAERPFIVKAKGMDVRVLGTRFDVQAYEDAEDVSVILVQGRVEVDMKLTGERVLLRPDEKFTKDAGGMRVDKVDADEYISWTDNRLIVNGKSLGEIVRLLERYYGCRISLDEAAASRLLSGKLELDADVSKVVESICLSLSLHWQRTSDHEINIETINLMSNP